MNETSGLLLFTSVGPAYNFYSTYTHGEKSVLWFDFSVDEKTNNYLLISDGNDRRQKKYNDRRCSTVRRGHTVGNGETVETYEFLTGGKQNVDDLCFEKTAEGPGNEEGNKSFATCESYHRPTTKRHTNRRQTEIVVTTR